MRTYKNGGMVAGNIVRIAQYNNNADELLLEVPRYYNGFDLGESAARISIDGLKFIVADVTEGAHKNVTERTVSVSLIVSSEYTQEAKEYLAQLSFLSAGVAIYCEYFTLKITPSIKPEDWNPPETTHIWDDYLEIYDKKLNEASATIEDVATKQVDRINKTFENAPYQLIDEDTVRLFLKEE